MKKRDAVQYAVSFQREPDNGRTRVLFVIKSLWPPGGAERLVVEHVRSGNLAGFRYSIAYLLKSSTETDDDLGRFAVPTIPLGYTRFWDLRWAWRLRQLLRRESFDVIHTHSPYPAIFVRLVSRTLLHMRRPALVYTEHSRWAGHVTATRLMNRFTYPLDDATIFVSTAVSESVSPRLRRRGIVLTHGINIDFTGQHRRFRGAARRQLGIGEGEVLIGTVANLRPQKGYDDLLKAAKLVIGAGLPATFVAVGQGPLEQRLRALHLSLGLGERFRFLGYREDAVRIMSAFDVFALASRHEGLPVAIMEALALGVPVVATSAGGIPEAVSDGVEGLLVPPGEPARLAAALSVVASEVGLRKRMATAAALRAQAFGGAGTVRQLEQLYGRLTGRS